MVMVNIRDLTHHFSRYLKKVRSGQRVTVMDRNIPVADIIPHNKNVASPAWKRPISKMKIAGESFAQTIIKDRREAKR